MRPAGAALAQLHALGVTGHAGWRTPVLDLLLLLLELDEAALSLSLSLPDSSRFTSACSLMADVATAWNLHPQVQGEGCSTDAGCAAGGPCAACAGHVARSVADSDVRRAGCNTALVKVPRSLWRPAQSDGHLPIKPCPSACAGNPAARCAPGPAERAAREQQQQRLDQMQRGRVRSGQRLLPALSCGQAGKQLDQAPWPRMCARLATA